MIMMIIVMAMCNAVAFYFSADNNFRMDFILCVPYLRVQNFISPLFTYKYCCGGRAFHDGSFDFGFARFMSLSTISFTTQTVSRQRRKKKMVQKSKLNFIVNSCLCSLTTTNI